MAPLSVLNPEHILFDRAAVRKHRDRAANLDWPHHRFLFQEVAERLAERLFDITTPFDLALDLGSRGGEFGEALMATGRIGNVVRADLSEDMLRLGSNPAPKVVTDEEFLPFRDNAFDLVGSVLDLHWTNDLPGALSLITRCLKPNGVFLGALFGVDSLRELKLSLTEAEAEIRGGVSPRISPFTEVRDAGSLLQRAGLALPVTDVDVLTLEYPHPFALMKELRGLGEANALISREKSFTSCSVLMRAAEIYIERFGDEKGRVPATFHVIYMTGWSPHESQQKPSRRGSGQKNLKDVL